MSDCQFLQQVPEYPLQWCTYCALCLLPGLCHVKLLPSQHMICVLHTTMHQFTVSLHYKPHTVGSCLFWHNLPPALLAEWPGYLLHAAAVTQGWNGYRNETWISTCLSSWRRWCWQWCCDPGSCGPPPAAPGRCWCPACRPSEGKLPPGPCPQTPAEQRTAEIQEHSLLLCGYIWALHCTGAAHSKKWTNPIP